MSPVSSVNYLSGSTVTSRLQPLELSGNGVLSNLCTFAQRQTMQIDWQCQCAMDGPENQLRQRFRLS